MIKSACLTEAALTITDIEELRILFANILRYSEPTGAGKLWIDHRDSLCQDISYRESQNQPHNCNNKTHIYNEGLAKIDTILRKDLSHYPGMPKIKANLNHTDINQLIKNHSNYNKISLKIIADTNEKILNIDQLRIYNRLLEKINNKDCSDKLMFVDGPGVNLIIIKYPTILNTFKKLLTFKSTTETFLYNTILAKVRSEGKIALAVASSGIAAALLDGGYTAHSMF